MLTYEPKAPAPAAAVQPKLVVGPVGDSFEVAADHAADAVVTGWRDGGSLAPAVTLGSVGAGGGAALDDDTAGRIHAARRGGTPLDASARTRMEGAFGADLSAVRVHADPRAGELCESIQAQAFTVGSDVFFRSGRPDTSSPAGRRLLAHELAHVVQQAPPGVIRRTYLDGQHDWAAASTHRTLGVTRGRTPAMQDIDTTVRAVRLAYDGGNLVLLRGVLTQLDAAITRWRDPARRRMRDQEVDLLKLQVDELLGKIDSWTGVRYDAAIQQHARHQADARAWIAAGRMDRDARTRNSCQWIFSRQKRFFVMTETADHEYRAHLLLGRPPTNKETTYFPDSRLTVGDIYGRAPALNAYSRTDASNQTNVEQNQVINGWRTENAVALTDVTMVSGAPAFYEALRHEMQHEADKHSTEENNADITDDMSETERAYAVALRTYKTEYRAHFYQGGTWANDDNTQATTNQRGFRWTAKQWAIFSHILKDYPVVATAWGGTGASRTTRQTDFRRKVHAYRDPDTEGYNKYNSRRIDALYEALKAVGVGTDLRTDPHVIALLATVDRLDRTDVDYLFDEHQAVALRKKLQWSLDGDAKTAFNERLHARDQAIH